MHHIPPGTNRTTYPIMPHVPPGTNRQLHYRSHHAPCLPLGTNRSLHYRSHHAPCPVCGPHPPVGLLYLGLALFHLLPVRGYDAFPLLTLLTEQVLQLLQLRLVDGRGTQNTMLSSIYPFTHSHTNGGVSHARRQPARQEQSG